MIYNKEYFIYINSNKWKHKKIEVFGLKGKKCQRCFSENKIHVHHACYDRFGGEEDILNDLFVLCENCHNEYHRRNTKVTIGSTKHFIKTKKFNNNKKKTKIDNLLRNEYVSLRNKKFKVARF